MIYIFWPWRCLVAHYQLFCQQYVSKFPIPQNEDFHIYFQHNEVEIYWMTSAKIKIISPTWMRKLMIMMMVVMVMMVMVIEISFPFISICICLWNTQNPIYTVSVMLTGRDMSDDWNRTGLLLIGMLVGRQMARSGNCGWLNASTSTVIGARTVIAVGLCHLWWLVWWLLLLLVNMFGFFSCLISYYSGKLKETKIS